jgi:hypothetical protein
MNGYVAGNSLGMSDRVYGRLACGYAVVMLLAQTAIALGGLHAWLGDGHIIAMVGLFAAAWLSGTLAIGRGYALLGAIGLIGSTVAFLLPT